MFLEVFAGKVSVAFHHVDDNWPPGFYISRLILIEEVEGADYVRAESRKASVSVRC